MLDNPRGRVLIVDDEAELRSALCEFFVDHGYEALQAADGQVALKVLEQVSVDVVILDIFMPNVDGIQFLDKRRAHYPREVVIAVSDVGGSRLGALPLEMALLLGAAVGLEKPFDFDVLLSHVERCLQVKAA